MNKSEQAVMDVIEGRKQWRTLYAFSGPRNGRMKKTAAHAIESLKRKGLIAMDKNSILRATR
ncbi:MAG: hypothetical protein WC455_28750 [Dehalococcoidia bacterium]|jgi:spore germination cell wall hydrolase CwlJ-like protein